MTNIEILKGDITKLEVDAIVNAANESLCGGGGVDGAIHRVAGEGLLEECQTLNGCKTGQSKITKGYNLPAKFVIHTVGPVWRGGNEQERELLKSCYYTALELARENNVKTIAFPAISCGVYHFPLEDACKIAISTTKEYLKNHDCFEKIVFIDINEDVVETYGGIMSSNRYLDEIIESFSEKFSKYFENKSGWNDLYKLNEVDELANCIICNTENKTTGLIEPKRYRKERIKTDFSITQSSNRADFVIGVPENNLERLLIIANEQKKNIANQIPTPDKGHVDLYFEQDNEINIIELKQWNGNDNPLFAIVELLKNYNLLLLSDENKNVRKYYNIHLNNENSCVNLILLAPVEYYNKFAKGCNKKTLVTYFNIIRKLNELLKDKKIKISLQYINFKNNIKDIVKPKQVVKKDDWRNYYNQFSSNALSNWKILEDAECWREFL